MSVIYVLQKEVPGLGLLTKIGMTVRAGEDRAAEYGGGDWTVVKEIKVAVSDISDLKNIEGRIHERLNQFRCEPAVGFGLREVFTCSATVAIAAAQAEIGSKADDLDQVQRMRARTLRAVERKIMQAHAADLARLHMGKYEKVRRFDIFPDWENIDAPPLGTPDTEIAEWKIHKTAIDALDSAGVQAPTFREMVKGELARLVEQWGIARQREAQEKQKEEIARQLIRAGTERQEKAKKIQAERDEKFQSELDAHNLNLEWLGGRIRVGKTTRFCGSLAAVMYAPASYEALANGFKTGKFESVDQWPFAGFLGCMVVAAVGQGLYRKSEKALDLAIRDWDLYVASRANK